MTADRATLDTRLDDLARDLPGILKQTEEFAKLDAFAGIADEIYEAAGPDDQAHVWSRLQCIQRDNGLIPGDEETCGE